MPILAIRNLLLRKPKQTDHRTPLPKHYSIETHFELQQLGTFAIHTGKMTLTVLYV